MKIKKFRKRSIFIYLISLFVLIFIIHNIINFFFKNNVYVVKDIVKVSNEISVNSLVIKDEYMYSDNKKAKEYKKMKYSVNSQIFSDFSNNYSQVTEKYIDNKLNDLEVNHSEKRKKPFKLENKDVESIVKSIRNNDFKNKILNDYQRKANFTEEEYFHKKVELEILKSINTSKSKSIESKASGFPKSSIDNYEDFIKYNSVNLVSDDFYIRNIEDNYNSEGLVVTDSMNMAIMCTIDSNDLKRNLKYNDDVEITIDDKTYSAHVINLKINDNKTTLVLGLDEGLNVFIDKRFVKIKVIDQKYKTFKLPKKSILEKDSITGVYVKKATGIIQFTAVNIIKSDDKFVYVLTGSDGYITLNNKNVRTINLYDNVINNPNVVSEGELIK